jgi:molybdopterin molybdotransferase
VRVALERRGGEIAARPTGNQSSGVLRSMVAAHGLLIFAAEATELPAGAEVEVQVLDPDFLAAADAGL